MQRWYRDAANIPPTLARVYLETLVEERAELYAHFPPPGRPILIEVAPFPVDDKISWEEEIAKVVLQMQLHCSGGPSRMRDLHLRMWLRAATREEYPDP